MPAYALIADMRILYCGSTRLSVCVGFGISDPDQARGLTPYVDGVVVSSTFERTVEGNIISPDLVRQLEEQMRSFKATQGVLSPKG